MRKVGDYTDLMGNVIPVLAEVISAEGAEGIALGKVKLEPLPSLDDGEGAHRHKRLHPFVEARIRKIIREEIAEHDRRVKREL